MEHIPHRKSAAQRLTAANKRMEELVDTAVERFLDESDFDFRDCLTDEERAEYEELERVSREVGRVVIEVLGGVAEVTSNPMGVEVAIIDHDHAEQTAYNAFTDFVDRADMPEPDGGEDEP